MLDKVKFQAAVKKNAESYASEFSDEKRKASNNKSTNNQTPANTTKPEHAKTEAEWMLEYGHGWGD